MDNGSTDGALNGLESRWPQLQMRVERLGSNHGFARANNLGVQLARGQWIALLNTDAYPEPGWLEHLLRAAEQAPQKDFFASRQIQFQNPTLLDGDGDAYHISGLAWRKNYNLRVDSVQPPRVVFSACGAAALYSRAAYLAAGGFDEDYFSYFEDVDLGFRLRLRGGDCHYVPGAVVQHVGSASTGKRSDFSVYHGFRNMMWTFIKDMPSPLLWLFLPIHVFTVLFFLGYYSLRGQPAAAWRALWDALRGLPGIVRKRRQVQRGRAAPVWALLAAMSADILEPYWEFMKRRS